MKQPILLFTAGLAAGAAIMWAVTSFSGAAADSTAPGAAVVNLTREKAALTARVDELERKLQTAAARPAKEAEGKASPLDAVAKIEPQVMGGFEDIMQRQAEADARREADRLALRLKLSPEQRESLHRFLLDAKKKEREALQAAMKDGGSSALKLNKGGEAKDAFLQSLLTPEQQAEYSKSKEEARTTRAEEYAQRKVRRLSNDLSLTEEQKDKLFQSYAQQKLAEPADSNSGAAAAFSIGGDMMELDLDLPDIPGLPGNNSGDKDREMLSGVLTPEQLAVYDQRRAERQEAMKQGSIIHFDSLDGGVGAVGGISVQVQGGTTEAPAPAPATPEK